MVVMRNSRRHVAEEEMDGDARWLEQKTECFWQVFTPVSLQLPIGV